ncbi:MAG TPA: aminotransferase class I/II-fold pyridoxal phosphate-dependent enzyme [Hyphomicrobiaceae bacterium]|nr:aminotransferase class I/II-fold pyridoxal phosphate-dependent enzyme [Hyphomicrobiaceae bacterium]
MHAASGLQVLAQGAVLSPFTRINRLLAGIEPDRKPVIEMTAGDPKEVMPGFVPDKLVEAKALLATYPKIRGSDDLRGSIAAWLGRRYGIAGQIDPAREIHPLNGSREGLFFAALPAVGRKSIDGRPLMLLPNPFYQAYLGATLGTNCEPYYLNTTAETGHLPDLTALEAEPDVLRRTAAFYLCSPANPQGAVASAAYLRQALMLARRYDFMLFLDECYSEIYGGQDPPVGGLEIAAATPERYQNLVVFNSLSKRSNLPGMRSGFAAGDGSFLETLAEIRNLTAPQMPGIVQHASAAVWSEEQHVGVIRRAYRLKFDIADDLLAGRFGYRRPAGGFFLWLDMSHLGGAETATLTLWKRCGVKVTPGVYLAHEDRHGFNPGRNYIRVALVHNAATVREALQRIVDVAA